MGLLDSGFDEDRTALHELGYRAHEGMWQEEGYGAERMVQERSDGHADHRALWDFPKGDEVWDW